MSNKTLTIDNVDLELLEKQRHALTLLLCDPHLEEFVSDDTFFLLEGLLNMLCRWADVRDGYETAA